MKLAGTVAAAMLALTMVLFTGGAMATIVGPGPTPGPIGPPPTLTYTVTLAHEPDLPGPPALFTPFFSTAHSGLVLIHVVNQDRTPHAYLLTGTGLHFGIVPFSQMTMMVYLSHPGQYTWISLMPYPGAPVGAPVGILVAT